MIWTFRYEFPHVEIYNVSYMWFSAIPCMWCVVVGLLFSLYKPQDPKTLNPELISPGLKSLFKWWPRRVTQFIDDLQIGSEYVSRQTSECKQNVRFTHRFYHVLPRFTTFYHVCFWKKLSIFRDQYTTHSLMELESNWKKYTTKSYHFSRYLCV